MTFIMMTMERNMITKAIRWVFALLDWVFYNLISILMQAIFDIANFSLSESIFEKLIDRVYLVLGIFMLFKITISLLTYLVNPDKISDKENGVGKLSMRVVLVLVMLIMLPSAFQLLNDVQNALLPTLPRLILDSSNGDDSVNQISDNGTKIATSIYGAFFYDNPDCVGGEPTGVTPYNQTTVDINYMFNNVNLSCQTTNNGSMYQYEYTPIISTLAGGFMCYVLIGICITVAIRMFKMMILRMIAPIPVISYVDPKSSKDGAFSKWVKILTTTWLELFINLGILYLIVFLVNSLLINSAGQLWNATQGFGFIRKSFFIVFVIIGLFAFARQAPKFIMDALGIKSQGNFMRAMGLSSVALGGIGAGIGATRASWKEGGLNKLKAAPRGLFNAFGSISAGGNAILSTDKPTLSTGYDAQQKYNSNMLSNISSGIGLKERAKAIGTSVLFGSTPLDDMDRQISVAKSKSSTAKQLKEYVIGEGKKKTAHIQTKYSINGHVQNISLDDWNQAVALANSNDGDGYIHFSDGTTVAAASSLANKIQGDLEEKAGKLYAEGVNDGTYSDPGALDAFRKTLADSLGVTVEGLKTYKFNGQTIDLYNDPTEIKKIEKSNQTEAFKIENSNEYSNAKKIYKKNSK